MNNELHQNETNGTPEPLAAPAGKNRTNTLILAGSILVAAAIFAGTWIYISGNSRSGGNKLSAATEQAKLIQEIVPVNGIELPARWNKVGAALVSSGVLDKTKFAEVYAERGGVPKDIAAALTGSDDKIKITGENSGALLNVLWALGLGQKNPILTKGKMMDPRYGGAGNFASTGGWTLGQGSAMSHYAMHSFMALNADAQAKVERVAGGIYRPCCGNSTIFPDCNHGMAMLGLMELMASEGASEGDMYKAALAVNRFWFPDTYATAAKYLASQGASWQDMAPKDLLSAEFSSGQGAQAIKAKTQPVAAPSSGGCGV